MSYYDGVFSKETTTEYLNRNKIESDDQVSIMKRAYTLSVPKNEQVTIDLEKLNLIHVMGGFLSIGISDAYGQPTTLGLFPSGGNLVLGNWLSGTGIAIELRSIENSELMVASMNFDHSYHTISPAAQTVMNKLSTHTLGRLLNAQAQKRYLNSLDAMELIVAKLSLQQKTIHLSSEEFAELIGCSRQQASRNLNTLKDKGIIERSYGGFQVMPSHRQSSNNLRVDSFPVL